MLGRIKRPISLQVEIADGEPKLTADEMQGYLWLAKGKATWDIAQARLESMARFSPDLALRMADICAQQGAAGLAWKFNNVFRRHARFDIMFGSPEDRLRAVLNAALLKGGLKTTLRNEIRRNHSLAMALPHPQKAQSELNESMQLLETALLDRPDVVLRYVELLHRSGLLSTSGKATAMASIRRLENALTADVPKNKGLLHQLNDLHRELDAEQEVLLAATSEPTDLSLLRRRLFSH